MPIYFEKTQRGEASTLSIYGTEEEVARLAEELKEGLALRGVQKNPSHKLPVTNLRSTTFEDVELFLVDEEQMASLKRLAKRKRLWIWAIWVAIAAYLLFWMIYKR